MTATTVSDEIPIIEASRSSGVPKRTIYRWVGSGRLKARTADGVQVVSLEAVRALAAARDANGEPGSAVPRAGTSAGAGTAAPSAQDGPLAARVFAAFDAGKMPDEVVRDLELPPRVVLELWRQHAELRDVSRPGRPGVGDRVAEVERRLEELGAAFDEQTFGRMLPDEIRSIHAALNELNETVAALPIPTRGVFTCDGCGAVGWVATHARCTACGRNTTWGFHPKHS